MSDGQDEVQGQEAGQEVSEAVTTAETDAGAVLDHAAELTSTVQSAIEKGKAGLDALQQHDDAAVAGSLVSNTIAYFTTLFHELEAGLGLYKTNAPVQAVAPDESGTGS